LHDGEVFDYTYTASITGMQSKKTMDLLAEFVNEKDCVAESGIALARLGNNKTRSNGFTIVKYFKL
jgi:hypothetical protein